MIYQRLGNRGIRLGSLFARADKRHPGSRIILDHDLDLAPRMGRVLTLAKVQDLVDDVASRLWSEGMRAGDHLVVYKTSSFDIFVTACAAARIGIIPVLLSSNLDIPTARTLMRRLGRPYVLTDFAVLSEADLSAVADHTAKVFTTGGRFRRSVDFDSLAGAPRVPELPISPDHPTLITHTSGTTGVPKLAVHTGRSMQARYRPQALVARAVKPRETVAIHVSFVHSRLFTALPISVLHGHTVVVMRDDSPESVARLFAETRPGLIEAHPNTFLSWEILEHHPRQPLAGVLVFSSTFDAIHPRTVETMLRASTRRGAVFAQMYGQSEVGPIAGRLYTRRRGMPEGRCVGFPLPLSTAVRVVPRNGVRPSKAHPGHIEVKSDGRIVTYVGEEARWRAQVNDGWWRMGDVGFMTRRGCLHMQDREIDLVSGLDSTLEIEDRLLRELPNLEEVVVVELSDGVPTPVICSRDDRAISDAEWERAVAGLPPLASRVQLQLDEMPKTSTTKVRRRELVARLMAD